MANQKTGAPIILHDEKLNFLPHEFYITDVIDERADKSTVASLVYKDEANAYVTRPIDLKDGAALAIKQFMGHNLNQNSSLRPVIISIKSFKLEETRSPGGRINGHLNVDFSFGLQKDYGVLQLVDYKGGTRYTRSDGQTDMAEPILRQGIEEALSWFNKWINTYSDSDPRLAKSVKVKLSDYTGKPEGDTIYYAANRPLNWGDFQDKPRAAGFEAEVFAGLGYTEKATVEKGIINLSISLKVDMAKSDCWVRDRSRDDYVLNHEQRHFDIAKIVGEHFKQKIAAMHLPPDNYDGEINVEYLETLRELHRMQTQYDSETHHGANHGAQEEWNEKIDKELKLLGVKK
ncbi:MAG TPA: DUF922 domain-containing protein [Mucilaginibacter sp.]|nr:DUF922 domain-containing protein [Mucilaginibacter sp.]